jgi:hypothetical protein
MTDRMDLEKLQRSAAIALDKAKSFGATQAEVGVTHSTGYRSVCVKAILKHLNTITTLV